MTETIIQLPNGWTLRSEAGDNVRLCLPNGSERIYWDSNEWHEDPVGVMGAIFGAAVRLPSADNTDSVKLAELEAEFEAAGGRGVELAEEIDALRARIDPVKLPGLSDIDWSGPADEIRDTLVEIWFQRQHWVDRDGDALIRAEEWADEMFARHAEPRADEPAASGYEDLARGALHAGLTEGERGAAARLAETVKQSDPMVRYPLHAKCAVCGEDLQFDIDPDGTPGQNGDWGANGDYGCITGDDEGSDGHTPVDIRWEPKKD